MHTDTARTERAFVATSLRETHELEPFTNENDGDDVSLVNVVSGGLLKTYTIQKYKCETGGETMHLTAA